MSASHDHSPFLTLNGRAAAVRLVAVGLLAALLIAALPTGPRVMGAGVGMKLLFLSRMAAVLLLATWLLGREGLTWADMGLRRLSWRRFAAVTFGGFLAVAAAGFLARFIDRNLGLSAPDYSMMAPLRGDLAEYLFWLLPVSIGSAAFGEEMVYRGVIRDAIERVLAGAGVRTATWAAIVLQALIFGSMHFYQGVGGIVSTGIAGLVFGIIWLVAGRNLWPGIVIHAITDATAITVFYAGVPVR